jgi:hypothetical protein
MSGTNSHLCQRCQRPTICDKCHRHPLANNKGQQANEHYTVYQTLYHNSSLHIANEDEIEYASLLHPFQMFSLNAQ